MHVICLCIYQFPWTATWVGGDTLTNLLWGRFRGFNNKVLSYNYLQTCSYMHTITCQTWKMQLHHGKPWQLFRPRCTKTSKKRAIQDELHFFPPFCKWSWNLHRNTLLESLFKQEAFLKGCDYCESSHSLKKWLLITMDINTCM